MGRKKPIGKKFWNKEYGSNTHLALSETPSEDLEKFVRFLMRDSGKKLLNPTSTALDLGCGNGRNLIYLAEEFGIRGVGFDISNEAIKQARKRSSELQLQLQYEVRSIAEPIPVQDESQTLVLDMMSSHFLNEQERKNLVSEVARVLKPGGWFFWKTFLLNEDKHAERLLAEHPGEEKNTYIHPEIGVAEHVFTVDEIEELLGNNFIIHKVLKSHGHKRKSGGKRRSVSVYAERNW
ncbi:MAG: class I SAM-dependent methyltransferase [Candidatus Paceibacterota bacterium]